MRQSPTALGWVDPDSAAPDWHRAQVERLARHLGYALVWPSPESWLPLADQVRQADVDAVVIPSLEHLDMLALDSLMTVVTVESVSPRLTFSR